MDDWLKLNHTATCYLVQQIIRLMFIYDHSERLLKETGYLSLLSVMIWNPELFPVGNLEI